jgi:hypothetical protein
MTICLSFPNNNTSERLRKGTGYPSCEIYLNFLASLAFIWTVRTESIPNPVIRAILYHKANMQHLFKGYVSWDFCFNFLSWIIFPQAPDFPKFWVSSKIREDIRNSRCTTGVIDTGAKWNGYKCWNRRFSNLLRHYWQAAYVYSVETRQIIHRLIF